MTTRHNEQHCFLAAYDAYRITRDQINSQQLGLSFHVFLVEVCLGLYEAHHLQRIHVQSLFQ